MGSGKQMIESVTPQAMPNTPASLRLHEVWYSDDYRGQKRRPTTIGRNFDALLFAHFSWTDLANNQFR